MSRRLQDINPGVRVYIPVLEDGVLYEVQAVPRGVPAHDIHVVSEDDGTVHALPPQTQVTICEEDDELHEYRKSCKCADCTERRLGVVECWEEEAI